MPGSLCRIAHIPADSRSDCGRAGLHRLEVSNFDPVCLATGPKEYFMKKTMSLLLMSIMGLVGTYSFAGSAREDSVDRLQRSVTVLHEVMSTPDKGIPEEVLSNAKCILVVPDLIKGGFVFG